MKKILYAAILISAALTSGAWAETPAQREMHSFDWLMKLNSHPETAQGSVGAPDEAYKKDTKTPCHHKQGKKHCHGYKHKHHGKGHKHGKGHAMHGKQHHKHHHHTKGEHPKPEAKQ